MNKLSILNSIRIFDQPEELADGNALGTCRVICDIPHDIQIEPGLPPESVEIFDSGHDRRPCNLPKEDADYLLDLNDESCRSTPYESMQLADLTVSKPNEDLEAQPVIESLESNSQGPQLVGAVGFSSSLAIHCLLLLILTFGFSAQVGSKGVHDGSIIAVRLITTENVIPQDASPSSVDSSASAPSIAGNEKPEEKTKAPAHKESILEESEKANRNQPVVAKEKLEEKQKPEDDVSKEIKKPIVERSLGTGPVDSAASAPSIASVERSFVPAAGAGEEVFNSKVLSAIKSAIFFPKKAVQEKHHGEVLVKFSIYKDGRLEDVTIIKSSGSKYLDDAVVKILEKASKNFPEFPAHTAREKLEFVAPILFKQ